MTRFSALLLAAFIAITAAPAQATEIPAATPDLKTIMADRVLGKADAPVTILEFASLTCSHCADFHTKTLPEIVKQAVDTGKAKIIFRDFPLDGMALRASALARCLPAERYFPFLKILFERQMNWAADKDPVAALARLGALAGLSPDAAKACMNDMKILDAITKARAEAGEKYKIQSTPSFIFNDGAARIAGARSAAEFLQTIDRVAKGEKTVEKPTPTAADPQADNHDNHAH